MALGDYPAKAMLVAEDVERAKQFYQEKLGLETVLSMKGVVTMEAGMGTQVTLYERENGSKAEHTVLGFDVDDLDQVIKDLRDKGVMLDMTDLPPGANEEGIVDWGTVRSAWIKDSEGNVIGINEIRETEGEMEEDEIEEEARSDEDMEEYESDDGNMSDTGR